MAYVHFNPNPFRLTTDDCTVRAISCALGLDWDETFAVVPTIRRVITSRCRGIFRSRKAERLRQGSAFRQVIAGKDASDVWPVLAEAMESLRLMEPRLYAGIIRKLNK